MVRHRYPPELERRAPQSQPWDVKTILSVGAMVFGLGVGIKTDIAELKKDVAALDARATRIEDNSVTKPGVSDLVREEMRKAQRDVDEAVQRARRAPPIPGFAEAKSLH